MKMLKKIKNYYEFHKAYKSPENYLNYLRKLGCHIGKTTKIFARPNEVLIDTTRPWLINLGENVQITRHVTILTHGYDWSVLKGAYGDVLGSSGKVSIGNNVFIGMNTTILKGTKIGNNCIIGANSLVAGEFPDNCVIAGNPAIVISDLDTYYKKRVALQVKEAKELVIEYYNTYGQAPNPEMLHEFFWIFEKREPLKNSVYAEIMKLVNNEDISYDKYMKTTPIYANFDAFIKSCLEDIQK